MQGGRSRSKNAIAWGPNVHLPREREEEEVGPVSLPPMPPEVNQLYQESRVRSNRTLGINDMAVSGLPTASNANRTMGGMGMQRTASEQRQFGPIYETESRLVVPTMMKTWSVDKFMNKGTVNGREGTRVTEVDMATLPQTALIEVRGSSRMLGRTQLAQVLPIVFQFVLNPQVMQLAASMGHSVDFKVLDDMLAYATGINQVFKIFRDMSPEETQSLQQSQMQQEQLRASSKEQIAQQQIDAKTKSDVLKATGMEGREALEVLRLLVEDANRQQGPNNSG